MIARIPAEGTDEGLRDSLFGALAASDEIGVAVCDREFRYLLWNRFMEGMTGLPAAAVLGRNALEIYPHLREERLEQVLHRVLDGETVSLPDRRFVVPGVRAGWIWVQYWPHRDANGAVAGVVGIVYDVTERKRAEEENERLAAFPRETPNPVLECDADGRVVYANPAATRLAAELGTRVEAALPGPGHADLVRGALASGATVRGVEVPVEGRVLSWSYHPHRALGVVHLFAEDVTARRAMEERLRHEALHDPLTGLPNRRLLMERLCAALDRGRRRGGGTALLFLDLDRFKLVNDSLGHPVGDRLLVAVADRLRDSVRPADTVARFGGDEFAVLLDGAAGADAARRAAEAIQRALAAPVGLDGLEIYTSASIGIAVSGAQADGPEALLRGADVAMYRAKAGGPGRCELYDHAMHARALARLRMETDLRRALDRGEVTAHYQPIVSLATGRVCGVEALARWRHPERGWVRPDEFVPAAEETGLILDLGRRILAEACGRAGEWAGAYPGGLHVSVNLSVEAAGPGGPGGAGAPDAGGKRDGPRPPAAGGDGERAGGEPGRRRGHPRPAEGPGRARADGRLRHGLLVAFRPAPPAPGRAQGGPLVRLGHGAGRARGAGGRLGAGPGARAGAGGGGGRHRAAGPARWPAAAGLRRRPGLSLLPSRRRGRPPRPARRGPQVVTTRGCTPLQTQR